jgi:hypothetical protein
MKMSELMQALLDEIRENGDADIEVCRYNDEDTKYYWMSCAFMKDGRYIVGYNADSLRKKDESA